MNCPKCKRDTPDDSEHCIRCGHRLSPTPQQPLTSGAGCAALWVILIICLIATFPREDPTPAKAPAAPQQATPKPVAPPKPPQWRKIASWKGRGTKTTEQFTVGSRWVIQWDTQGDGTFAVEVHRPSGAYHALAANVMGADTDQSYQHAAGTYYLDISATQPYAVGVKELR